MLLGSGAESIPDEVRTSLAATDAVHGLVMYTESQARHGGSTLRLVGMEQVKGHSAPGVLEGRLPAGDDELALGRLAARSLDVDVGDDLPLTGQQGDVTYHVTGLVVVPSIGLNEGIGQDGVMTMTGLARLDPEAVPTNAGVTFDPAVAADEQRRIAALSGPLGSPMLDEGSLYLGRPAAITNIARVRPVPFILAALLGALSLVALGRAMIVSVRSRRKDIAVLRALGADRGWIGRAVRWQATAYAVVPLIAGVPLGLIAGRLVFRRFADSIGTVNDASLPLLTIALTALLATLVANVVAVVSWRVSLAGSGSTSLRTE
jgi:ABC-type lipoprotein release transport system permease subunit